MSADLYQIIYISTANAELTEDALLELLSASQKRNAARKITGLLLHSDGNIIQVIEGPEAAAQALYKKIASDSRHRGVTLISGRSIEKRDFPEFKMGFKRARSIDFKHKLPGFTDVVEKRGVSDEQLAGLSKLVAIFIRTFAKSTNIDHFGK
ncbi:MAG TPA: BLUF domain-containing protein [Opitutales bacterium]|nr:BLUF domain-containing protein [Opitutales bacterium]